MPLRRGSADVIIASTAPGLSSFGSTCTTPPASATGQLRSRHPRALGVHSKSGLTYSLDGGYQTFQALLGITMRWAAQRSVIFRVYGDEKLLFESPVVRGGDSGVEVKVPLKGVLLLRLVVDYADNGDVADHANWADARLLRP
jgi:hypothetical protein